MNKLKQYCSVCFNVYIHVHIQSRWMDIGWEWGEKRWGVRGRMHQVQPRWRRGSQRSSQRRPLFLVHSAQVGHLLNPIVYGKNWPVELCLLDARGDGIIYQFNVNAEVKTSLRCGTNLMMARSQSSRWMMMRRWGIIALEENTWEKCSITCSKGWVERD